ncbi:hypothetical protein [Tabrizicola aquatica]|uniref:hypothetical protein n=1 Tax=Tabrizicola aquatica TaxID=909926 RepID=UPI001CA544C6|nr:hypothetical protein [Tabrizicola aquatica]
MVETPQHVPNAGKSLRKTLRECTGNICQCLADKINELVNRSKAPGAGGTRGLVERFAQQVAPGAQGPGTTGWINHENEIRTQQDTLQQHLDEHDGRGCPPGGLPAGARSWANKPVPSPADWQANNPVATPYTGVTGSAAGDVAAGAATVGLGYLLYRGIRMLPSLAPPLWWSIPGNLAVP